MKMLLATISLIGICVAVSSCSDEVRSQYPDRQSALEQGNLAVKGWMPEDIPDTSREISEWHNIDVNTGAGRFMFDLVELPTYLEKMKESVIAKDDLAKVQGLEKHKGAWTFFRVKHFVIGVERNTGEGFWYVNPKVNP